jgi:hypothetical protein
MRWTAPQRFLPRYKFSFLKVSRKDVSPLLNLEDGFQRGVRGSYGQMHILLELHQSLSPVSRGKGSGSDVQFSTKKLMGQFLTAQFLAGIMIRLELNSSLATLPGSAMERRPQRVI